MVLANSLNQSQSFFDIKNPLRKSALLPSQADPSLPAVDGLERATNLLIPDYLTSERLDHFPADLYDLRPSSHLVRFIRSLLGDSGTGSTRKRFLVARLQQSLAGTHFGDIERFYGEIFGARRLVEEHYDVNPYKDLATGDEWDDIHARDTSYRERIFALARAINMGPTIPGLKTAAEAIIGSPVEIFEKWQSIDWLHGHGFVTADDHQGRTWTEVASEYPTYDDLHGAGTYFDIEAVPPDLIRTTQNWGDFADQDAIYSGLDGQTYDELTQHLVFVGYPKNDRGEIVVRPVRLYDITTLEGRQQQAQDERVLRQVLNVLKPASARVRIIMDNEAGLYAPLPVRAFYCDSNYFEVIARVQPNATTGAGLYPVTNGQAVQGIDDSSERVLARPPFTASSGGEWNYNNEVVAVRSYVESSASHVVVEGQDFEYVPNAQGQVTVYTPDKGVLDPRQAEAGRLSNDITIQAHPYAADRILVQTHG